jgi:hypothetical protein
MPIRGLSSGVHWKRLPRSAPQRPGPDGEPGAVPRTGPAQPESHASARNKCVDLACEPHARDKNAADKVSVFSGNAAIDILVSRAADELLGETADNGSLGLAF